MRDPALAHIEAAWLAGFYEGMKHKEPWDDMHDWAALSAQAFARMAASQLLKSDWATGGGWVDPATPKGRAG